MNKEDQSIELNAEAVDNNPVKQMSSIERSMQAAVTRLRTIKEKKGMPHETKQRASRSIGS